MRPGDRDDGLPHRVSLELLGAAILVRCRHETCAAGIAEYLSAAVVEQPWRTPDVIVDVEWEHADRFLFRARPGEPDEPLGGVRVHARGIVANSYWSSPHPPLPPLEVEPFAGRFVALHAGAVTTPDGGAIVVAGDKGAGKTTVSVTLVNEHGCSLLTDEVTFLHRRSLIVEPFPRSVGVADEYDTAAGRPVKRPRRADLACRRVADEPALVRRLAFLEPGGARSADLVPVPPLEAFRLLLANELFTPTPAGETMLTLMQLARSVPAVRVRYGSYADLLTVGSILLPTPS